MAVSPAERTAAGNAGSGCMADLRMRVTVPTRGVATGAREMRRVAASAHGGQLSSMRTWSGSSLDAEQVGQGPAAVAPELQRHPGAADAQPFEGQMVEEIGEDRIAHVQHAGGGVGIQA